jgi:hypothetical protein
VKKHSRFKHKKKHIPQILKKLISMQRKKKNIIQTFVQLNNENQYWHEDLLLFEDDEKTFINNTSWLGSPHMDTTMKQNYNIMNTNLMNIHYIMQIKNLKKMPLISPYKYEQLDFSIFRPCKHTYTMYFV